MNFTQVVGRAFCNFNWKEFLIVKTNSAWVVFVEIVMIKETKKKWNYITKASKLYKKCLKYGHYFVLLISFTMPPVTSRKSYTAVLENDSQTGIIRHIKTNK